MKARLGPSILGIGCLSLIAYFTYFIVRTAGWYSLAVIGAFIGIFGMSVAWSNWRANAVAREFLSQFPGKHLLVVYTDSPHWAPVIEREWLPRWTDEAVFFNRSRPWKAGQIEARLWRSARGQEHTPLAIIVPPSGKVAAVRLFRAFRDHKHGKSSALRNAERAIQEGLANISRRDA